MQPNAIKIFSLHRIKTFELVADTIDFLIDRFKQLRKLFTVSSPFGQILFVVENLAQLIFYYIEDSISELNINEATRSASIYSLSSLAGHNPTRSISASGEITLYAKDSTIEDIPNDIIIIPNYLKIKCLNNDNSYVMDLPQDEIKLSLSDKSIETSITIKQGVIETQTFTGKGHISESISVNFPNNFFVDEFVINVYINDVKWKRHDSIFDMPRNEKGYMIRTGVTSGIDIFFGNGNFGVYPSIGDEIKVEYLVTEGFTGRVKGRNKEQIIFEFEDTGFTTFGDEVNLNEVLGISTSVIPDFGVNPEPIELTKLMMSKNNKALITLPNYELLLRRLQAFSIVKVFPDEEDERMINLFLIPDVTKLIDNNEDYFTIPEDRFILTDERKNQLLQYIERCGTKLIATDIKILEPVLSKYILNISIIAFDDIPTEIIKKDIIVAISDYFLKVDRKKRIPRSDIIKIIENIDGVDSVNINIICEKNERSKIFNINNPTIGLDTKFNDVLIDDNELPIIRGGWKDRNGNNYDVGISDEALGAVNIQITEIVTRPK